MQFAGTERTLALVLPSQKGLNPFVAAVPGMVTCIGDSVVRDALTLGSPTVLRAGLDAVTGAGSIALGLAAGLCLFLRLMPLHCEFQQVFQRN